MDIQKLENYVKNDWSLSQIGKAEGKSVTTVRYWLKKYRLKTTGEAFKKTSRIWSLSDEEFSVIVKSSDSIAESLRALGLTKRVENYQPFRRRCAELGIQPNRAKNHQHRLKSILRENSTADRSSVKAKILRENLLDYSCQICGMAAEWNGKPLGLTLDHINGVSNDHRIDNLRFVCPNCDRQLPTYCNKNWK